MTETEKLVPKRRFKEFINSSVWEQRKLGEVVDVRSGKDYKHLQEGSIPVYGTGGYMLSVNEALSYLEDAIGIGRKGTIDKPYILKAPFWTVDTLFYAFPRETNDLNFVFDIFQNIDWKKKDESTGVPSLSKTSINEIDVLVPKTDEQRIIGAYFAKIDNLITLHQSKVEKIKALKSAYLSEMFPAEGECRPKRRFAGFTEDWEQRKLTEIGNIITGSTPKTADSENYGGEYLFISPADIQGNRYVDNTITVLTKKGFEQGRRIRPNASLFVSIGSTIGKVAQASKESITNQQINTVEPFEEYDDDFIFTTLEFASGSIKSMASNQAVPIVNKTTFGETKVLVPGKIEEERQIGTYFRNLDNLITLHQRKLEKLQNIKKAFLNEMFI